MRKSVLALIAMAVLVTSAVVASSASALVKPRVFTLLEVEGSAQTLGDFDDNRPPAGGDQLVFTNSLYRWNGKKGTRVGHDRVLFTFMTGFGPNFSHNAVVLFQAQVYLPDGSVFVEGYGALPPDERPVRLELPVVGGTGVYANARGYVNVRAARRTLLEFHLMP